MLEVEEFTGIPRSYAKQNEILMPFKINLLIGDQKLTDDDIRFICKGLRKEAKNLLLPSICDFETKKKTKPQEQKLHLAIIVNGTPTRSIMQEPATKAAETKLIEEIEKTLKEEGIDIPIKLIFDRGPCINYSRGADE